MNVVKISGIRFTGGGECPVQYEAEHEGHRYHIRYHHSVLTIELDGEEVFFELLASEEADDGCWTEAETQRYLTLIGDEIMFGGWSTAGDFVLPRKDA